MHISLFSHLKCLSDVFFYKTKERELILPHVPNHTHTLTQVIQPICNGVRSYLYIMLFSSSRKKNVFMSDYLLFACVCVCVMLMCNVPGRYSCSRLLAELTDSICVCQTCVIKEFIVLCGFYPQAWSLSLSLLHLPTHCASSLCCQPACFSLLQSVTSMSQ